MVYYIETLWGDQWVRGTAKYWYFGDALDKLTGWLRACEDNGFFPAVRVVKVEDDD